MLYTLYSYSVSEKFNLIPLKTIRFEKHFHQKRNKKLEMIIKSIKFEAYFGFYCIFQPLDCYSGLRPNHYSIETLILYRILPAITRLQNLSISQIYIDIVVLLNAGEIILISGTNHHILRTQSNTPTRLCNR